MSKRGRRVAVARVKNGVLHIVAPLRESVLKLPKQHQNLQQVKRDPESDKRINSDNLQENPEESNQLEGEKRNDGKNEN
jgi:hypothetical protein|tara:strand:- start:13 stop:249 length:237 start_codon:yes stop_codon:yes gene_type:complete